MTSLPVDFELPFHERFHISLANKPPHSYGGSGLGLLKFLLLGMVRGRRGGP